MKSSPRASDSLDLGSGEQLLGRPGTLEGGR